ncbi:MAG: hypothetical protein GY807_01775 [Gammaproteobacteria bacterium]|nr:hypothetical protein [Gammaproteobacteria bacterium]
MNDFQRFTPFFSGVGIVQALMLVAVAFTLITAAPLQAQQQSGASEGSTATENKQMQEFEQIRSEYVKTQQRLEQIQAETLQARPELKKQEQTFNDLLVEEMKSGGHTPIQDLAEIEGLQAQLSSDKTADTERQELTAQFQHKVMAYRKAQSQALQSEKVKKVQSELMEHMVTAMKKQDPQTEQLLQQMAQKRQQLEQMLDATQSKQQ